LPTKKKLKPKRTKAKRNKDKILHFLSLNLAFPSRKRITKLQTIIEKILYGKDTIAAETA
jgi:hypothetical protein